jgi:hypothetical protein
MEGYQQVTEDYRAKTILDRMAKRLLKGEAIDPDVMEQIRILGKGPPYTDSDRVSLMRITARIFQCPVCGNGFNNTSTLKRHIRDTVRVYLKNPLQFRIWRGWDKILQLHYEALCWITGRSLRCYFCTDVLADHSALNKHELDRHSK